MAYIPLIDLTQIDRPADTTPPISNPWERQEATDDVLHAIVVQIAGGHVIVGFQDVTGATPLVKAGKLKLLAVTGTQRTSLFPDVPTFAEEGAPGVTTHFWSGFSLPAGTPDAIAQKWEAALKDIMNDPAFPDKLKSINAQAGFLDSTAFAQMISHDMDTYKQIVKDKSLIK